MIKDLIILKFTTLGNASKKVVIGWTVYLELWKSWSISSVYERKATETKTGTAEHRRPKNENEEYNVMRVEFAQEIVQFVQDCYYKPTQLSLHKSRQHSTTKNQAYEQVPPPYVLPLTLSTCLSPLYLHNCYTFDHYLLLQHSSRGTNHIQGHHDQQEGRKLSYLQNGY
ncbi:hypothetical protein Leryth_013243 [Lithospermum erythrorhizon]|nr:hypothetical protein Leryth_013243 [Lithospermum erythrorhizon]